MLTVMPTQTSRYRILLVDDDVDIARVLKLGLEQRRFVVDAFTDPAQALISVKPGLYDLALVDIQMPKIDGFDLYRRLRGLDEGLAVVFLTAFEMHETEYGNLQPDARLKGLLKK